MIFRQELFTVQLFIWNRKYGKNAVRIEVEKRVAALADFISDELPLDLESSFDSNSWVLATAIDDIYFASLLQPLFLAKFAPLSFDEIDKVMQSFRFENCDIHPSAQIVKKYCTTRIIQ